MNQFAHITGIERFNQPESRKLEFKQALPKNATSVLLVRGFCLVI